MKKKKFKRRKLPFVLVLVLSLVVLIAGGLLVYAATTAYEQKENDFHVGNLETKVEEANFSGSKDDIIESVRGDWISKEVGVRNTGNIHQFVRVMVFPEIKIEKSDHSVLLTSNIGGDSDVKIGRKKNDGTITQNLYSTWKKAPDGYYYYLKALPPGEKTKNNLFEAVRLANNQTAKFHGAQFSITIKIEAINCAPYAYRDAWWNGLEPTAVELVEVNTKLKDEADDLKNK